ncbi:MAG: hypothetical protein HND43_06000 [Armatimonadetes bacterium]|nr:hypothetical protein [Armatimonadota bacterium]NOG38934.1 hypothetical protein [Armatimonadota bacterium]GIK32916.1 MAG: hypothetical protein BroJett009_19080 [Armatimonadota bacterium]
MWATGRRASGSVRKEVEIIRFARLSLIAAIGIGAGCGSPSIPKDTSSEPEGARTVSTVSTGTAELVRYGKGEDRPKLWSVRWQTADLEYSEAEEFSMKMDHVSGALYAKNEPVAEFRADSAYADKASDTLILRGHVWVEALNPNGTVFCSEVKWLADSEVIQASGGVRLESRDYKLGPIETLWCSPDLRRAGTPDLFAKTREVKG